MKSFGWVFALVFLAVCRWSAIAASADPPQISTLPTRPPAWDARAAGKYLDARMDLWFDKAKKLRTGQGDASCVSCHTVVPYALARSVLRKATGVNKQTPQEVKLLEQTLRRVE